jgi:coenzyme F420 hydrogenase subunit beta
MNLTKIGFEESLATHVVNSGRCLGCGACILVCPFNCLEYKEEKPSLVEECPACGICARICPQYEGDEYEIESFVFGRERKVEEEFGIYRRLVVARANDERIRQVCQDGGAVTALLFFALQEGLIDCAVVAGVNPEEPFSPRPELAFTVEEILKSAGTKYFYSPNVLALNELIRQKKSNVAFVGTPCQVQAIRKMQMAGLKKYCNSLKFLIGLMCSECFTYEGLMTKHIHEKLGVNLSDIRKINIKGKMLVSTASEIKTIPLSDIKQYARKSCSFCHDFSSESADISAGGLGLEGWTFIVVRTDKGEELFSSAEKAGAIKTRSVDEEVNALNLLRRLSVKKRQR